MSYWGSGDEKAFFTWLVSIKGVKRTEGIGTDLWIYLRSRCLSDSALRDMIAIYKRYDGDMRQLAQFVTQKNKHWFKDPKQYWYKDIFAQRK